MATDFGGFFGVNPKNRALCQQGLVPIIVQVRRRDGGVFRPALGGSVTDFGLDYTYGPCANAAFPDCSFPHNSWPHDCLAMS